MTGCSARVYSLGSFRDSSCSFKGKLEYQGKLYCKIHFPPNVKTKRKALHKKWDKETKDLKDAFDKKKKAFQTLENFIADAHHCSKCKTAAIEAHQAYLIIVKGDN